MVMRIAVDKATSPGGRDGRTGVQLVSCIFLGTICSNLSLSLRFLLTSLFSHSRIAIGPRNLLLCSPPPLQRSFIRKRPIHILTKQNSMTDIIVSWFETIDSTLAPPQRYLLRRNEPTLHTQNLPQTSHATDPSMYDEAALRPHYHPSQ